MKADTLIIDGRHALWRTSDAFKMLSAEVGGEIIGTGGMYGFLCLLTRVHQKYGGDVIIAWEGVENFRKKLYPDYKLKPPLDEEQMEIIQDMRDQERRLKGMLRLLGIKQFYGDHCEADDVIGRISLEHENDGKLVIIYSGDSDLRQLVTEQVFVVSPGYSGSKDTLYDQELVIDKHKVIPGYISDLKALAGDSSDNIPGVKGIGAVYASKLINVYGGVNQIIDGANGLREEEWPLSERFKAMITDNVQSILLYKELTTIQRDMPMKEIAVKPDETMLLKHFRAYRFSSLMASGALGELLALAGGN